MSREYTIILVSEKSGKHYSFKMRLPILILLILTLIGIITTSYFSISKYVNLHQENCAIQNSLELTKKRIADLESENRESELYNKWADHIIYRRINNQRAPAGFMIKNNETLPVQSDNTTDIKDKILDVDELKLNRINLEKDFEFSFNLINTGSKNIKKTGYVFIVVCNDQTVPSVTASYPSTPLNNGKPEDYKKGMPFSIRYLKNISGRIEQPDIGEKYNQFYILAYSEKGSLLLNKSYSIETKLNDSPYL